MPICQMKTNYQFIQSAEEQFLSQMAEKMSQILEKPLPAIMVSVDHERMMMNRTEETVFFAEFRYVKEFDSKEAKAAFLEGFANQMLELIIQHTHVDPYRVYMQFTEMPRDGAWHYVKKKEK